MVEAIASYIGIAATVLLVIGVVAMLFITYIAAREKHEPSEMDDENEPKAEAAS